MSTKSKKKELFVIANLGKVKDIPIKELEKNIGIIKKAGIDALSVDLKSKIDCAALETLAPLVKKHRLYLLGAVSRSFSSDPKKIKIDSFKVNTGSLKNPEIVRVSHEHNMPLFVCLRKEEMPKTKKIITKTLARYHAPLAFMFTSLDKYLFPRIGEGKEKGVYLGYNDKTSGVVSAILALSWGARIIEKALTFCPNHCNTGAYTIEEFKIFTMLLYESKKYL